MFPTDHGERGADAERGQVHHVPGVAEHDLGQGRAELDHRFRFGADGRAGGAEQEGEDHDLERVVARHGVDDAGGKDVLEDRAEGGLSLRYGGFRGAAMNRNAGAGAHQVDGGQPQQQRQGGDNLEIEDGLAADAAHAFHVAAARDAHHQRAKDQRRDDGADQLQKHPADGRELPGEARRDDSESHARGHPDEDPGGERDAFQRSPHFSFWRRTSKNIMCGGRTRRSV